MNQNQIGRTVFDIYEENDTFYLQKAIEYHEWLLQQEAQPRLTRTPIFRDHEGAERRLRAIILMISVSRMSISALMKCTAAIRQFAYGSTADTFDEYLQMKWASFVKSFTVATDPKHTYFKQRQESARKDVERAFGVLHGRWRLIQQPPLAYEVNTLRRIMYAGIIMHNMILEDQNMSIVDLNHVYYNPASQCKQCGLIDVKPNVVKQKN
nr:protein ALP1-like [Tanacetum cinerariifolium]